MAKQELPVDFKDDVLQAEMAGKRKYRIIQNEDGTISLEDVTNYSQIGSNFGAAQMNATNLAVNESFDKNKVIDSLADIVANEATGYAAGALAVRELNGNFRNSHKFSTSEIDTGETWVDGKKIYRRTYITTDTVYPSATVTIPISLEGIADTLWIDQKNSFIQTLEGTQVYPLPMPRYSGTNNYVGVWCNKAGIRIFSDSGWNEGWKKVVTVRYTKV